MNRMMCCAKLAVPAIIAALFAAPVYAANCANDSTGNWNARGTWGTPGAGCVGAPGGIPGAADNVTIANINATVTIPAGYAAAANSVTIATGNQNTTLTFGAATSTLAVTNDVIINRPTNNNRTKRITVLTGAMTVGGNVTLIGGTTATRDALLSASTGSITIGGGLTVTSTVATSSTVQLTGAGTITVNGAAGVTNGDTVSVGTGIFDVTNAAATFNNSNAAIVAGTTVSTGTLNVSGNLFNAVSDTITVSGAGNITVAGALTNDGVITLGTTGTVNANGAFTNSATGVFTNTAAGNLNIGGNATQDGTFTAGTGTVTFNGAAAQTFGGAVATNFYNLTINNTGGDVTIISASSALSPIVGNVLTLTSGHVITTVGTNNLGSNTAGTVSGGSAASHVVGDMLKSFPAGNSSFTFPIGDGTNYQPVTVVLTGATAGTLSAWVDSGDHPDTIANISRIDQTKSANHYWTLSPGTLATYTSYDATFQFGAAIDATATTANFIVAKKNAGAWMRPTVGVKTATTIEITGLTSGQGFGEFAVGELLSGVYKGVNQLIDLREIYE